MGTTSSWRTRLEVVFDQRESPLYQRRPYGHPTRRGTKRGCKKRSLRARLLSLLGEESGANEEDDEDAVLGLAAAFPPALPHVGLHDRPSCRRATKGPFFFSYLH